MPVRLPTASSLWLKGRSIEEGTPDAFFRNPQHACTKHFVGEILKAVKATRPLHLAALEAVRQALIAAASVDANVFPADRLLAMFSISWFTKQIELG
ncbi:ABC-type methionine transport system ATPase subunit [Bradyrhizobium sp. F1.13.1]